MKDWRVFLGIFLLFIFQYAGINAQDFKTIRDGIEYAEIMRGTEKEPIRANLLRLDLTKVRLDVVHAMDAAIGLEKTSSIATRHGAFAAINAGFFRIDKSIWEGDDVAVLQIDGQLLSESLNNRIALFINNLPNRTEVSIDRFTKQTKLKINKKEIEVSGINRQRKDNETIIYTPFFHRTTLTNQDGLEIIVRGSKITQIRDGKGSSEIPADGFVISASGKNRAEISDIARIGKKAEIFETANQSPNAEDIVAGVPQLIKNGKLAITWQEEKAGKDFTESRHPRTAVAKLTDGKFLMVTIDGRQPEHSIGMNLQELAELLLELGATDAMNLDGGGSTMMYLDGKVVNKPSDKDGERKVSDAILVFPRNKN